jgi:hypothetical protein
MGAQCQSSQLPAPKATVGFGASFVTAAELSLQRLIKIDRLPASSSCELATCLTRARAPDVSRDHPGT